jgi:hypothetical protein
MLDGKVASHILLITVCRFQTLSCKNRWRRQLIVPATLPHEKNLASLRFPSFFSALESDATVQGRSSSLRGVFRPSLSRASVDRKTHLAKLLPRDGQKRSQSKGENSMKRTFPYASHLLVAAFLTQLPTLLRADCIPSAPTGYTVPFTLVTLKNSHVASYATGSLAISDTGGGVSLDRSTTLSATHIPQLFSDRTYCPDTGSGLCLTQQPFDIFEADQLGVTISEVTSFIIGKGFTTSINATLTLESWGNGKISFAGSCANTGELYGTFDSNTFAVIACGTPVPPSIPPK